MDKPLTRRDALRTVATAGAGALLGQGVALPQEKALQVAQKDVEIALASISPETVRITIAPIENGQPMAVPDDGALVKTDWAAATRLRTLSGARKVTVGNLVVTVSPDPLVIRVETKQGRVVQELKADPASGQVSFLLGDSPVLGLGQGGPQFDRRGQADRMGSGQGGYKLATHGARVPIQWLVGTSGWGMYIHQPLGSFDLTGKEGLFQTANPQAALPLDVFVVGATNPAAIMAEYAKMTGNPEMVPLWSLGYQQSHRTMDSAEETLKEAKTFREKKLPCDMMIYLGTGFCPAGWNTDNGEFVYNPKTFPEPKKMIDQLHADNFKVVMHAVLEGRKMTGRVSDPCTAEPLPSGRTADRRWPNDRQVSCYWPVHRPILETGVDGWWPDQGDGLDAPSRLARNRMYFEGMQVERPNQRVYALHRNAYAGMQRYAAFLWTGDNQSRWETLKLHIPVGINTAISGIPWWGSDIGGFVPTEEFTGELFARWFQVGAFNPLFRSHGRNWKLRVPWGWNQGGFGFNETPSYKPDPKELQNEAIEPIIKKYLELRYQMMPYLYSHVKECCDTGMPIIRALWFHYGDDPAAVARGDEYLWGRSILVAPVVEKGATSRKLYLPRGAWFDFWNQERLEGGREIDRKVDLATMPLYVRAGSIVPMDPVRQYTWEKVDGPTTLWVYPGADAAFALYEDDGTTFNFRKGEYMRINIVWNDKGRRLSMRLAQGSKMLTPKRNFVVKVAGESKSKEIVFDGRPAQVAI